MGRQGRPGERRTERPYGRRINRWFARRPLAGAPASPASPESPAVFALPRRVSAPSPKHGVRSPPCPLRPPGPDVRLARTHGPPPPRLSFVSFVSFVISKTIWQFCVFLRGSSCSSCQPRRAHRPHPPSGLTHRPLAGRSVFRSPFSVLRGGSAAPWPRRAHLPHPSQRPHLCGKHAAPLKNTLQKGLYLLS